MHSKTIQLGVIVLALRLLGKHDLHAPRIVSKLARILKVSRKAGYEAAERIEKVLSEQEGRRGAGEDPRREILILRIRNQVLTYERDHPEVRFSKRGTHLPREAKSFCVRVLRDFRAELSETEIASLLGVPLPNLRRWDAEANEDCSFPKKPDHRGRHSRSTAEDARKVVDEFQKLKEERKKPLTLEEFTEHYNKEHPEKPLDRRTITRILEAEELVEVETRSSTRPYHDKFEIHYPGAQASIDATKCDVNFVNEPPETISVSKEIALDVATSAVLGDALKVHENSDGAERVVLKARKECETLLAVLSDNGPANRAGTTRACVERVSAVGHIFSFPYHPQTNGHIEGFFGQFSRIAGKIEIDDSSRESIARSVVESIWRIYFHFHNYSPRKRLGGLGPLEYLRRYRKPPPEKVEEASEKLQKRKERSDARRYPRERLCDPRFRSLVEGILERNRLEKPLDGALKALLDYDQQVIESSSEAFYSYSQRDSFEESKRTFAYFMGIVRKKQEEIDAAHRRQEALALKQRRLAEERKAQQGEFEREKQQEEEDLCSKPERVVLNYANLLLAAGLKLMRKTLIKNLRRGLKALRELGRPRRVLDQLAERIRSMNYQESLKEEMIQLLRTEYDSLDALPDTGG